MNRTLLFCCLTAVLAAFPSLAASSATETGTDTAPRSTSVSPKSGTKLPFTVLLNAMVSGKKHVRADGNRHEAGSIGGFEDTAEFVLYAKGTPIGVIATSLDKKGNYHRTMTLSMGNQQIAMAMTIVPDGKGNWKTIDIVNPALGDIHAARADTTVNYIVKGDSTTVALPAEYILYDDYGMIFESFLFRRYDMKKGGKQTFARFRIPETIPGNVIPVEIEYLGDVSLTAGNKTLKLRRFAYSVFGVRSIYWVDKEGRIYMGDSQAEQVFSVRKGFEELLGQRGNESGGIPSVPGGETKKTVMIPLRDGARLATDLYFPAKMEGPCPVILIRTPYGKDTCVIDGSYYAGRGYVTAVQDVRGRFASEGTWEPILNEGDDGYDVIEWLAAQEWCSGKVGMIGASYCGWVQLLAAVRKPPHLAAIIPNVAPPDPLYNIPYEYGVFFLQGAAWWLEVLETEATADLSMKKMTEIAERRYDDILKTLPAAAIDTIIFGKENAIWRTWIAHNANDDYWRRGSYLPYLKDVTIPVFLQTGWFDPDGIGAKLAFTELMNGGNASSRLVIGPWGHTDKASSVELGKGFGEAAGIDLQGMYDRWFDRWLKGTGNDAPPEEPVWMYAINAEKWLKGASYPLPETVFTKLYLSSVSGANSLAGDGALVWSPSTEARAYDSYRYDPADPTPAWIYRAHKGGRREYEKITTERTDILVFTSEPFDRPVTIAGPMKAVLYASSSAEDTDWFVTFFALDEKGAPLPLGNQMGKGCIRARFRSSLEKPELLVPGNVNEYTIDLWHTGVTIPKGWRLRVEITSAFFPYFSRNLNTGGNNETETAFITADQRIYHDDGHPSHILLPVIPEDKIP